MNTQSKELIEGLCRDCITWQKPGKTLSRCSKCGSPRVVRHPELKTLAIAHIDCDAFYASVEKRDDPSLADKPVIIGGGKRGVVSTCCYIARIRGVHSAMPMFKALEACPDAIVIKPHMSKYSEAGHVIREMMRTLTPMVEPLSIDEAFLDMNGTQKLHGACPAEVLVRLAKRIEDELDLTVSVGLSYCKDFLLLESKKPLNFYENSLSRSFGVLARLRRRCSPKMALQNYQPFRIWTKQSSFAGMAPWDNIWLRLSRGEDSRSIKPGSGSKSVSKETTFNDDKSTSEQLLPILRKLSQGVSSQLKKKHIAGQTVVVKLKTSDFKTRTRSRQIPDPTQLEDRIFRTGSDLLLPELDGTKFRLLGIGVSTLGPDEQADPDDMLDPEANRRADAERAIDTVREKFGSDAVKFGINFKGEKHGSK
ncbi:DNA polymerase IV [Nymphon striatum]|nr:DNA polymerase IV [Nymphon striatum]